MMIQNEPIRLSPKDCKNQFISVEEIEEKKGYM